MTINDFANSLHSDCINNWFTCNTDNLIQGQNATPRFNRENEITARIVNCINIPAIVTQQQNCDIIDTRNNDIGEAAHNGTFQPALYGINHIIQDYFKRRGQGYTNNYFALLYLMDIENLDTNTNLPANYVNLIRATTRPNLLQTKYEVERLLNLLPNKILVHEPFHNFQSSTETTILNYDIYVLKMDLTKKVANDIHNVFKDKLDYFNQNDFDKSLLE